MSPLRSDITAALGALAAGDAAAEANLWQLVYSELRTMAQAHLARERGANTLVPTALVHEAYLRLLGDTASFENRAHFFAAAGRAMRRILVDHARSRQRDKRGAGVAPITLLPQMQIAAPDALNLLEIDDALRKLEALDADMVSVVELRWFAGLSVEEAAAALGHSPRTVNRLWTAARAWLIRELAG